MIDPEIILKNQLEVLDRFTLLLEANENSNTGMSAKEIYWNLVSDLRVEAGKDPLCSFKEMEEGYKKEQAKKLLIRLMCSTAAGIIAKTVDEAFDEKDKTN